VEAISTFTKGLELLKTLPDTPERAQQELRLQVALGTPLIATKGYTALEVETVYSRARALCQQIGETPQLFPVLGGLCSFYFNRGELQTALELAAQLLRLAQSVQDPGLLLWAHYAMAISLASQGELTAARAHLERGIALYDPQKHSARGFVQDPGVSCLTDVTRVLWLLGYPDQALRRSHEALLLARKLSHPFSLARTLNSAAYLCWSRGEQQAARELKEANTTLSSEQGFPVWMASGTFLKGVMLVEQGQGEAGIAQMCQGLAAYRAMGTEIAQTGHLAWLAEAYGKVGRGEEGLILLIEALVFVDKTGERVHEAELYRLKGELTLQSKQVEDKSQTSHGQVEDKSAGTNTQHLAPSTQTEAEAEACFLKAIDIARRQQAKSLELRAVMSLARLWQQQGKKVEALQLLAEIYGWFTEGFDTKDLQEAKALLNELS
jgi:predicted ATPase